MRTLKYCVFQTHIVVPMWINPLAHTRGYQDPQMMMNLREGCSHGIEADW